MRNKDPFGMQKPAQQFRSMLEIQRDRAEKAEAERDLLRHALQQCAYALSAINPTATSQRMAWESARAALAATEETDQ